MVSLIIVKSYDCIIGIWNGMCYLFVKGKGGIYGQLIVAFKKFVQMKLEFLLKKSNMYTCVPVVYAALRSVFYSENS